MIIMYWFNFINNNIFYELLGTPTLSKLLEAPANPYIPNPPQATQKNKLSKCKNLYSTLNIFNIFFFQLKL